MIEIFMTNKKNIKANEIYEPRKTPDKISDKHNHIQEDNDNTIMYLTATEHFITQP